MKISLKLVLALAFYVLCAQSALAGAPLKGIDVKLGKNPGGGCAARTTNGDGEANFGLWPKGNYTLSFAPTVSPNGGTDSANRQNKQFKQLNARASSGMHIVIQGAAGGKIERDIDAGADSERVAPILFSLSGTEKLIVLVTAAR
jgi:hypothetical protein